MDIADTATAFLGRKVCKGTVSRWLTEANIQIRNRRQAVILRNAKYPEIWAKMVTRKGRPDYGGGNRSIANVRKMIRARIRAVRKRAMETRPCVWCNRDVTRRKCDFRRAPEKTFCGLSCATKSRNAARAGGAVETMAFQKAKPEIPTFTLEEAAAALGIGVASCHRRLREGLIASTRIDGEWFIPRREIEKILNAQEEGVFRENC